MQERRLSPKMRMFAKLITEGHSPSESYRRAYDCSNSTSVTVSANACKLLKDPRVSAVVQQAQQAQQAQAQQAAQMKGAQAQQALAHGGQVHLQKLKHADQAHLHKLHTAAEAAKMKPKGDK